MDVCHGSHVSQLTGDLHITEIPTGKRFRNRTVPQTVVTLASYVNGRSVDKLVINEKRPYKSILDRNSFPSHVFPPDF